MRGADRRTAHRRRTASALVVVHALREEDGLRARGDRQLRGIVHFLGHFCPFPDPQWDLLKDPGSGIRVKKGKVERVNGLLKL